MLKDLILVFGICFIMGIVGKCIGVCAMEENGWGEGGD